MDTTGEAPIVFNRIVQEEIGRQFELSPLPVSSEFKLKYSKNRNTSVYITSEFLSCPKTGGIRMGEMNFGGAMVVHYGSIPPAGDYDLPIFGFDFIYANKFLIAVIDLHPVSHDPSYIETYIAPLREVSQKYAWIPKAEGGRSEAHEWAKAYDSGYSFYRWCEKQYMPDVENALRDYLRVFCAAVTNALPLKSREARSRRDDFFEKYRNDYTYYDPGSAPLKTHFGEDWGERYMKDFLFAP